MFDFVWNFYTNHQILSTFLISIITSSIIVVLTEPLKIVFKDQYDKWFRKVYPCIEFDNVGRCAVRIRYKDTNGNVGAYEFFIEDLTLINTGRERTSLREAPVLIIKNSENQDIPISPIPRRVSTGRFHQETVSFNTTIDGNGKLNDSYQYNLSDTKLTINDGTFEGVLQIKPVSGKEINERIVFEYDGIHDLFPDGMGGYRPKK